MRHLFEPIAAAELISRLASVEASTLPRWGKMNAAQMMAHCQAPFENYFGEKKVKRTLTGILLGRLVKKKLFTDKPWRKNLPTAKEFVIADERDFEKEKDRLIELIQRFSQKGHGITPPVHPFFGKMTPQEWAMLTYKHTDHHLQQFGA